jgi:hypothetical protein
MSRLAGSTNIAPRLLAWSSKRVHALCSNVAMDITHSHGDDDTLLLRCVAVVERVYKSRQETEYGD